jgi:hypothetical protein
MRLGSSAPGPRTHCSRISGNTTAAARVRRLHLETMPAAADPRAAFLDAAVWHGSLDAAASILAANPAIAASDIFVAAVLGDDVAVRRFLDADPANATAIGGPHGWDALTYLCFSKYLFLDPGRTDAFVRAAAPCSTPARTPTPASSVRLTSRKPSSRAFSTPPPASLTIPSSPASSSTAAPTPTTPRSATTPPKPSTTAPSASSSKAANSLSIPSPSCSPAIRLAR